MNRPSAVPLLLKATIAIAACATLLLGASHAFAAETEGLAQLMGDPVWQWGLMAAALSTGLSALAAGIAVARVGSAAVGLMAEKPELFGRALILVGLAEGIAIYGLIVSILILNRLV